MDERVQIGRDCIALLFRSDSPDEVAELFWDIVGYEDPALELILTVSTAADERGVRNLCVLIERATPSLAFTKPVFVKSLLRQFTGSNRQQIVEAIAAQAVHLPGGVFAGDPNEFMARRQNQVANDVAAFPEEPGYEDLIQALRRMT